MTTELEILQKILDKLNEEKVVADTVKGSTSNEYLLALEFDMIKYSNGGRILISNLSTTNKMLYYLVEFFKSVGRETSPKVVSAGNLVTRGFSNKDVRVAKLQVYVKNYKTDEACPYQIEYIGIRG